MQRSATLAMAVLALCGVAWAQPSTWQAVVLTPPGAESAVVTAIGAGRQYGWCRLSVNNNYQAGYWQGLASTWTPLADTNFDSTVHGADEAHQVGSLNTGGGLPRATLWRGTAKSAVGLHPPASSGAWWSSANGAAGNVQVGEIVMLSSALKHAALWYGTSASFVDLHPLGATASILFATDGMWHGGAFATTGAAPNRAAIWQGTPESMVSLHPPGATASEVRAMVPGLQAGYISVVGGNHAGVWRGTAASFENLNPPGATLTKFFATNGTVHAGVMGQGGLSRAAVNFGTPSSWVGLQQFMPPNYSTSEALAVYQSGSTVIIGGWAANTASTTDAILWIGAYPCYPNCDASTGSPALTANDFQCFLNKFAAGDTYANCDGSTGTPSLTANDFQCFLNRFAEGCE